MALLRRVGDEIVVTLNDLEKVGALRGDVRVPFTAVRSVRRLAEPVRRPARDARTRDGDPRRDRPRHLEVEGRQGLRRRLPGRPAVVVELEGAEFSRDRVGARRSGRRGLAAPLGADGCKELAEPFVVRFTPDRPQGAFGSFFRRVPRLAGDAPPGVGERDQGEARVARVGSARLSVRSASAARAGARRRRSSRRGGRRAPRGAASHRVRSAAVEEQREVGQAEPVVVPERRVDVAEHERPCEREVEDGVERGRHADQQYIINQSTTAQRGVRPLHAPPGHVPGTVPRTCLAGMRVGDSPRGSGDMSRKGTRLGDIPGTCLKGTRLGDSPPYMSQGDVAVRLFTRPRWNRSTSSTMAAGGVIRSISESWKARPSFGVMRRKCSVL